MHLRRVTEQLGRPAPRHVSDMWKVMISGLVRRSVMRICRSPERVMPPHIAMHAVAQIERYWGGPELGLLPALAANLPRDRHWRGECDKIVNLRKPVSDECRIALVSGV
jgi:hypothetical protein